MATTAKLIQGTKNTLTSTGFSTLASATYVATSAYNCATNKPLDVAIEVECATTNTPAGNKQVVVFAKVSLDGGTTWSSGVESGTTTTDEPNLRFLGTIPMNSTTTTQRGVFSLFSALGFIPSQFKLVLKNDLGVALTSGAVSTAEISGQSV